MNVVSRDTKLGLIKLIHREGLSSTPLVTWVDEVSLEVRVVLVDAGHILVDWHQCCVTD